MANLINAAFPIRVPVVPTSFSAARKGLNYQTGPLQELASKLGGRNATQDFQCNLQFEITVFKSLKLLSRAFIKIIREIALI